MSSNLLGTDVETVLGSVIDDAPDEVLIVNPSRSTVVDLVDAASTRAEDVPSIRVLADERVLKDVMDDFLVAGQAADLVAADVLAMRTTEVLPRHSLLLTPERVVSLVSLGDQAAGIATDETEFVEAATGSYETDWDDAAPFTLRTPPISNVRETLADEIGPEVLGDFDSVLASMETARGDDDDIDEVTVSLLVAARNEVLLYDISKWGEDVGIASKATFSRTKTRLEDLGLIDTEKVPIDVGRPRLRLRLADDRLEDAAPDELASVATSALAA
jgi:hypothetical protein